MNPFLPSNARCEMLNTSKGSASNFYTRNLTYQLTSFTITMSSSPTITNLYDFDDYPNESFHEPDNPPDIRVVSQSLNAVALRIEDINTPPHHGAIMMHIGIMLI